MAVVSVSWAQSSDGSPLSHWPFLKEPNYWGLDHLSLPTYCSANEMTMEVHFWRNHSENVECGLCEFKAKSGEHLETHLVTCEIYKCEDCDVRFTKLSDMKRHKKETHAQWVFEIIYAKLDKKNQELVSTEKYEYTELFPWK